MTSSEDSIRVSTLELFFDLVFVFTITQLTAILLDDPGWRGLFSAILMLGVTWWMYGGYAWLTNAVPPTTTSRRLLLMAGMAGFLIMALAIPGTFDGHAGLAFGLGYLLVTGVHTAPISLEAEGTKRGVTVGDVLGVEIEQAVGLDGANPTVITNPPLMAVPQPVRQGKSTQVAYRGPWEASFSGRNAFITEFAFEG